MVVHRGYPLHYPENTLIGMEAAMRTSAGLVEFDLQPIHDLIPVLFHEL